MTSALSIDPGIEGTGISIWPVETWKQLCVPSHVEVFGRKDKDWIYASHIHSQRMNRLMDDFNVVKVYCEFPQYFTSGKGHAATAAGDIYKLAMLVGVYAEIAWQRGASFHTIIVNDWKGQLSKEAVIARIERRLPDIRNVPNLSQGSHEWDAIGIGLFAKGVF